MKKNLPGAQGDSSVATGGIGRCCGRRQHVHLRLMLVVEQGVVAVVCCRHFCHLLVPLVVHLVRTPHCSFGLPVIGSGPHRS